MIHVLIYSRHGCHLCEVAEKTAKELQSEYSYQLSVEFIDGDPELEKEYGEKVQIAKMNVDENQGIPAQFGIRGIPTLILFKNGAVAAQKVGALSKSQLTAFLDSHI